MACGYKNTKRLQALRHRESARMSVES
jgi:hypothetical protein